MQKQRKNKRINARANAQALPCQLKSKAATWRKCIQFAYFNFSSLLCKLWCRVIARGHRCFASFFFHHNSPYFVDYVIFIYLFFAIFFEALFYLHKFVSLICLIYSHKHRHTPTPLWKRFSTSFYVNSCWSLLIVSDLIIGFVTTTTTIASKISTQFVSTWFKCDLFLLLFGTFVCLLVNKPKII